MRKILTEIIIFSASSYYKVQYYFGKKQFPEFATIVEKVRAPCAKQDSEIAEIKILI